MSRPPTNVRYRPVVNDRYSPGIVGCWYFSLGRLPPQEACPGLHVGSLLVRQAKIFSLAAYNQVKLKELSFL